MDKRENGMFRTVRMTVVVLVAGFLGSPLHKVVAAVVPLEGESIEGEVTGIADGMVRIGGVADPVPVGSLLRVENQKATGAKVADSAAIYLVGGGLVPVDKMTFDAENESVEVEIAGVGVQKLSIDVVGALLFDPKADLERFEDIRANPSAEIDRVLIDVGAEIQVLEGLLNTFTDKVVSLEVEGEVREFPREKVTGIVLASIPSEAVEDWVEVVSVGGSVYTGKSVTLDESGKLAIDLGAGEPLKLAWGMVERVEFFSPAVEFLSDLKPQATGTAPIVALPREPQLGRNVLGGEMLMEGRVFRRGLGMAGGSEVTFSTSGFERFRATVGIDDAAAGRGDCEVVIQSGGKELYRARIKGGEVPQEVNIGLEGAVAITLKVDAGADLDLADYVDWGNAVLVKKLK